MMKPDADGPPSPRLSVHVELIASTAPGPILDAPCGRGRNAIPFAKRGRDVLCADVDIEALAAVAHRNAQGDLSGRLIALEVDLLSADLPFAGDSIGAIINVHFVSAQMMQRLLPALRRGGFLYAESYENRKGNYLQLPKTGEFKHLFHALEIIEYSEKKAGPEGVDAVTFTCFARKP